MTVAVCMLRAVNVGGHNKIKMDALRALFESLDFQDARTYIQSGNIVFRTKERETRVMQKRIDTAIEKNFGFRCFPVVRTVGELRAALAKNPFAKRPGIEPNKLLIIFLAGNPAPEAEREILTIPAEPEELRMSGRELFIYFPNGMARPKLSLPRVEKLLATPGTGRNWNTVRKLVELADELENC